MTSAPSSARAPLALGDLLVSAGLVQDAQLRAALAQQQSSGEKLGVALTHMAAVDGSDTAAALMVQRRLREQLAYQGKSVNQELPICLRVGELLVAHGDISRTELDLALQQLPSGKPLGALLVQMGALSNAALERVLKLQKRLCSAVLRAGIGFSFAFISHTAVAGDTAQLIISATVASHIRIGVRNQPTTFTVSTQDISRGYVDVNQPSELAITTNSGVGVALEFHGMDSGAGLTSIQITGGGSDFRMAPSGGILLLQGGWHPQTPRDIRLTYRLWLAPQAHAGTYDWPLSVTATAL